MLTNPYIYPDITPVTSRQPTRQKTTNATETITNQRE